MTATKTKYLTEWVVEKHVAELEARNAMLVAALEKISNGDGYYGAQAREYKEIAREALQQSTEKP